MGVALLIATVFACPARADGPFDDWMYSDRGRVEIAVGLGGVTNDPFLKRLYVVPRVALHVHEVLAVDLRFFLSPNLGDSDLSNLAGKLQHQKEVVPDISRILFAFTPGVLLTPLHLEDDGIAAFDLSLFAGAGLVVTEDDRDLISVTPEGEPYFEQTHPVLAFGLSARLMLDPGVAFGFHPQWNTHVEQVHREDGMNLETKQNFFLVFSVSFLTPAG